MVHCPECDGAIAEEQDVEFIDLDAKMEGLFRSSKRFYRRSRPSASGLDPEGEGRKPC